MRLRVKYSKTNEMRYISHLDVMRYFQKVLRRSEIDVCLSEGFSPHIIMSFALPLSVGMESVGEYFDAEVNSVPDGDLAALLNSNGHEDFHIESVTVVPDTKQNKCMTLVAAADYVINVSGNIDIPEDIDDKINAFLSQKSINIIKHSKKGDKETDIRPGILGISYEGDNRFEFALRAGSVGHINPLTAAKALFGHAGIQTEDSDIHVCRKELYAEIDNRFIPLKDVAL